MVFVATESTQVRVAFDGGPTDGVTYYIDNVSLRQASDIVNNDPVDDSRIVFNASAQDQTIPLGDTSYCDVDNNVVTAAITLGAFESKILLSCFCNHDGVCNNRETAQSCGGDCPK